MGLTLAGIGFGLAAAFGLTSLISTLLYETSSTDALSFAAAAALLLLTARRPATCLLAAQ